MLVVVEGELRARWCLGFDGRSVVVVVVVLLVVDEDTSVVDVAVVGCEVTGAVVVGTVDEDGTTGAAPAPAGTASTATAAATTTAAARRERACASCPHRCRAARIPSRRVVRTRPAGSRDAPTRLLRWRFCVTAFSPLRENRRKTAGSHRDVTAASAPRRSRAAGRAKGPWTLVTPAES
ncbi:MAG TPA: hypothetical protein VIB48_24655 [Acidimicrobiia bacterium]